LPLRDETKTVRLLKKKTFLSLPSYCVDERYKGKGSVSLPFWVKAGRSSVISLCSVIALVRGYTAKSVTYGQCDARPTVTFPAAGHPHHCTNKPEQSETAYPAKENLFGSGVRIGSPDPDSDEPNCGKMPYLAMVKNPSKIPGSGSGSG